MSSESTTASRCLTQALAPASDRTPLDARALKACCAIAYDQEWVKLLLGASLHPGALALTERLGTLLDLPPGSTVVDVACGSGASTIYLARRFGWRMIGVDLSEHAVDAARVAAAEAGLTAEVQFARADGEQLPLADGTVDAVLCECVLCTMPNKAAAVAEFARVLRPGGVVGIADLTREGELADSLSTLAGWISCVADAQPIAEYTALLRGAGLPVTTVEAHDDALLAMVRDLRKKLLGAELLTKLALRSAPSPDLAEPRRLAALAEQAARDGLLGYSLLTAAREHRGQGATP